MESTPYTTMAELIRQAALEEATMRARTRSPLNTSPSSEASSSISTAAELSTEAGAETEELSAVYEDEKARNDALAKMLDKVCHTRSPPTFYACRYLLRLQLYPWECGREWKH